MDSVSPQVIHRRELEKESLVANNENLLVILIFTNDFNPEMNWLCRALNAKPDSIEEAARILQGYGYLFIVKNKDNPRTERAEQSSYDDKEYLHITPSGKRLVLKIRSKLKAP